VRPPGPERRELARHSQRDFGEVLAFSVPFLAAYEDVSADLLSLSIFTHLSFVINQHLSSLAQRGTLVSPTAAMSLTRVSSRGCWFATRKTIIARTNGAYLWHEIRSVRN
jgi:hypothetical protein